MSFLSYTKINFVAICLSNHLSLLDQLIMLRYCSLYKPNFDTYRLIYYVQTNYFVTQQICLRNFNVLGILKVIYLMKWTFNLFKKFSCFDHIKDCKLVLFKLWLNLKFWWSLGNIDGVLHTLQCVPFDCDFDTYLITILIDFSNSKLCENLPCYII